MQAGKFGSIETVKAIALIATTYIIIPMTIQLWPTFVDIGGNIYGLASSNARCEIVHSLPQPTQTI
jgi:hypothetical protein